MKKTIFTAMMLIGMMGSAQTIESPVVLNQDSSLYDVWVCFDYDTTTKYFWTKNRNKSIDIASEIMYDSYGQNKWEEINDSYSNGVRSTEWSLPNNYLLKFIKNENEEIYLIVIFDYNEN